jgi:hypothetical protein
MHGEEEPDRQVGEASQVFHAASEPLQALRAKPIVHSQIWGLPYLFSGACLCGPASRRDEVELVAMHSAIKTGAREAMGRADA